MCSYFLTGVFLVAAAVPAFRFGAGRIGRLLVSGVGLWVVGNALWLVTVRSAGPLANHLTPLGPFALAALGVTLSAVGVGLVVGAAGRGLFDRFSRK